MAITGIGNTYNAYGNTYASQKNSAAKKTETKETLATQAEEAKKSAGSQVSDYYDYLSKTYDCVKDGSVTISGSYLRQCANDPEKAKELEENLALFKDLYKQGYESAKQNAQRLGGRVVDYSESWNIDSKGNITMISSVTVETENGTKSPKEIREEREERLKEKKEEAKKAEKAKAKKEEEQERMEILLQKKQEDVYRPKFDVGI